ncbi:inositol monophosphatase [Microbacterium protaetiae]|uniref:Inositol monophosphatase n=1 Tax=Microbacterium protaetiae TaxID=2509458 RepID=A0A4P6EB93_9MICO|nr:inositol monophosphatase family protein [Microbacterium protaetiae]QAY58816.1 inositol monophosphatase [Microbacterium protaetiae]
MDLEDARLLAVELAREAGDFAVAERNRAEVELKGECGDVVTYVDRECERRIVERILERYPGHAILGEETGTHGPADAEYRWLIDPLDGTNNYVLGIDYFGSCVTLCRGDEAIVAVMHNSTSRHTYSAVAGRGTLVDEHPLTMPAPAALKRATVAWTQGYNTSPYDEPRNAAFASLEYRARRVLRTWCPAVDWGLIISGTVAGMVAYRSEEWDRIGGVLLAREAGAAVRTFEGWTVAAHPSLIDELVATLGIGNHPG